jgi:hypothetical protein
MEALQQRGRLVAASWLVRERATSLVRERATSLVRERATSLVRERATSLVRCVNQLPLVSHPSTHLTIPDM